MKIIVFFLQAQMKNEKIVAQTYMCVTRLNRNILQMREKESESEREKEQQKDRVSEKVVFFSLVRAYF